MNTKKLALAALISGSLGLIAVPAHASLELFFDDGVGNTLSILDGSSLDADTSAGTVEVLANTFVGAWKVSGNVGVSLADPTGLHMHSLEITKTTFGSGTMSIDLKETGLTIPALPDVAVQTWVGGTTNEPSAQGGARFETWLNGLLVSSLGSYSGGAFSGTSSASGGSTMAGFTLEEKAFVTHTGAGTTSFDMHVTVPEPATLALLGLGLIGFGFARRRSAV